MDKLNSDDLRAQLQENNLAMNILAEDNEKIVELLAQRGLQAIEPKTVSPHAAAHTAWGSSDD